MQISVVNLVPQRLSTPQILRVINAVNRQIREHFEPYWHMSAILRLDGACASGSSSELAGLRGDAVLYLADEPSGELLGFHKKHASGTPMGFVFLDVCERMGHEWSIALSHESLEMLSDPMCNLLCRGPHPEPNEDRHVFHWFEVCDPVQGDHYEVEGVKVSNFVLPAFYTGGDEFEGRNDYLDAQGGKLRSFSANARGYLGFFDPVRGGHGTYAAPDDHTREVLASKDDIAALEPFRRKGRRQGDGPTTTVALEDVPTGVAGLRRNPSELIGVECIYLCLADNSDSSPDSSPNSNLPGSRTLELELAKLLGPATELRPLGALEDREFEVLGEGVQGRTLAELWPVVRALRTLPEVAKADLLYTARLHRPASNEAVRAARVQGNTCSCDGPHLPETENNKTWATDNAGITRARKLVCKTRGHTLEQAGEGVLIAHPDTGYTAYLEAQGKIHPGGIDYTRKGGGEPIDPLRSKRWLLHPGHGTRTGAALVGQLLGDGDELEGVAPGAKLLPYRISNSVIQVGGIHLARAIRDASRSGAHVISMSVGGTASQLLKDCILEAYENDLILVAAAGNCVGAVIQPARHPHVIGCAAVDINNRPWCGSSHQSKNPRRRLVDIAAPGDSVWTMDVSLESSSLGRPYEGRRRGTSFAVTMVAGTAALWLEFHGREQLLAHCRTLGCKMMDLFRCVLHKSAHTPADWDPRYGVGVLDAHALIETPLLGPVDPVRAMAMPGPSTSQRALDRLGELFPTLEQDRFETGLRKLLGLDAHASLDPVAAQFEAELEPILMLDHRVRSAITASSDPPETREMAMIARSPTAACRAMLSDLANEHMDRQQEPA